MKEWHLPICTRDVVSSDGGRARTHRVFCPRREQFIDVGICRKCEYASDVSSEAVECAPPGVRITSGADALAGSAASTTMLCVQADVTAMRIVPVMPSEPWALPVVEEGNRFIGFISPREIAAPGLPPRLVLSLPVRHLAVGGSLALRDVASLRDALLLMMHHRMREVALVDEIGATTGILTDIDALRAVRR